MNGNINQTVITEKGFYDYSRKVCACNPKSTKGIDVTGINRVILSPVRQSTVLSHNLWT